MNTLSCRHFVGLFALVTMAGNSGSAATITWSNALYVNAPPIKSVLGIDQFDQSGALVAAVNLGGVDQVLDQTIDIAFTATSPYLDRSSLTQDGGNFYDGSGNNLIAKTAGYVDDNLGPKTITLNNLANGNTYRIQALLVAGHGSQAGWAASFDGNSRVQFGLGVQSVHYGDSVLFTGVFTATGTSQSFTVERFIDAGSGASSGAQINALTLYETAVAAPEPSSFAMLLFGMAAWLRAGKRRK